MARNLKGVRWSFAEDRRVLELAALSRSPEEIANLMNRSLKAVLQVALRLGFRLTKIRRRSAPSERLRVRRADMSAGAGTAKKRGTLN
jgi:hypothetical protein